MSIIQVDFVGCRKKNHPKQKGGGVFTFKENGRQEWGTFPFDAIYEDGKQADFSKFSQPGQVRTFVNFHRKWGSGQYAESLVLVFPSKN